ncbi:MAG: protein kinase [Myxococcales bacterium]|nr:protein kinase [Myxococcales bacterium]
MRPLGKRAQKPPSPGLVGELAGEYRIIRRLGAGGFGTVYEAEHPVLKRRAAVKVLHEGRSLDAAGMERFISEARAASQIQHRNVVDIFSFGTLENGQLFYTMDLLDGVDLDTYQRACGPLEPACVVALLSPVAEALDKLHAAGVIHRDVKPGNIFLSWESNGEVTPKLLDFGLIKLLGDSPITTASDVLMGTPYYMAPEQCRGEAVDARTDVYALGAICHELCTGRVPFVGDSATAVLLDHVQTAPPRMSEVLASLPAALDEPVLAMLAKRPSDRPATAALAITQLDAAVRATGCEPPVPLRLARPAIPPREADPSPAGSRSLVGTGASRRAASGVQRTSRGAALAWGALAVGLAGGGFLVASMEGTPTTRAPEARSAPVLGRVPASDQPIAGVRAPTGVRTATAGTSTDGPHAREPATAPGPAVREGQASVLAARPAFEVDVDGVADEATSSTVWVTLAGAPAGTQISMAGRTVGSAHEPLVLPRGTAAVEITLTAPGHKSRTLQFVPDGNLELEATLSALARRARPSDKRRSRNGRKPGKSRRISRDLESPF